MTPGVHVNTKDLKDLSAGRQESAVAACFFLSEDSMNSPLAKKKKKKLDSKY